MDEYHPYFDTTPDYLNIAAGAAGLGGTAKKRCKISSMRCHKPSLVQRKEGLGAVIMHAQQSNRTSLKMLIFLAMLGQSRRDAVTFLCKPTKKLGSSLKDP